MSKVPNLVGRRFGGLLVVGPAPRRGKYHAWRCQCDCGHKREIAGRSLLGGCRSCGCAIGSNVRTHGWSKTRTWNCWRAMKNRCDVPTVKAYHHYGGRGIKYCERWRTFENFLTDMGPMPEGKSLGRIDNDNGYCKENCEWQTPKQQQNNTRRNVFAEWNGERLTLKQWADRAGINYATFLDRIERGWTIERAVTTPVNQKHRWTPEEALKAVGL